MRKRRILIIAGVIYLLAWLPNTWAQKPASSTQGRRKYDHHGSVSEVYEPSRDQTSVTLLPYRVEEEVDVFHSRQRIIRITAAYNFSGTQPVKKPDVVAFAIIADTVSGTRFKSAKLELTAKVDGEQITLGKLKPSKPGEVTRAPTPFQELEACSSCRIFREELVAHITYEGLVRIAQAKKVELLVGPVKLKLGKDLREALGDLASRATP